MNYNWIYVSVIQMSIVCVSIQAQVNDDCTERDARLLMQQWNDVFSHKISDATELYVGYMIFAQLE